MCNMLHPTVIRVARAEASREGWRADFDGALAAAGGAIDSPGSRTPCQPAGSDACVTDFGDKYEASASPAPRPACQAMLTKTLHCRNCFAVAQRQRTVTR